MKNKFNALQDKIQACINLRPIKITLKLIQYIQ